jgi:hypothetical protein
MTREAKRQSEGTSRGGITRSESRVIYGEGGRCRSRKIERLAPSITGERAEAVLEQDNTKDGGLVEESSPECDDRGKRRVSESETSRREVRRR